MASHWKSRRLAGRALKVLARHTDKPAIAAHTDSLAPDTTSFIAEYDGAGRYEVTWRKEMAEGKGSMGTLAKEVEAWKPLVAANLRGYDLTTIGDRPTVPEDLIHDALDLADAIANIRDAAGATPSWIAGAASSLRGKAADAERETDEAATADARHNELLAGVRSKKVSFDAKLSLFRNTLRAVLGQSHPDFQKLRAEKASASDVEDDVSAPPVSPPVVTPAG